jgi:mannose-6-phosphate isomerase-like protein (cupin superfamily)
MTRALRLTLLAALPAALAPRRRRQASGDGRAARVHVKDAKWAAPKAPEIPPGVMGSPIASDPNGPNIGYAKFAPGYTFPMHWHSFTEYTVLISGKGQFTVNGKTYDLEPGSYIVIPARRTTLRSARPGQSAFFSPGAPVRPTTTG